MRRPLPVLLLLLAMLAAGAVYFFSTTRMVGRQLLSDLPEPNAFEGPDLVNAYILARAVRGPACFIEAPDATVVMPPAGLGTAEFAVVRVAVVGAHVLGEVASLKTGDSVGFFFIDTTTGEVSPLEPEAAWRSRVRDRLHAAPPELVPADTYAGP